MFVNVSVVELATPAPIVCGEKTPLILLVSSEYTPSSVESTFVMPATVFCVPLDVNDVDAYVQCVAFWMQPPSKLPTAGICWSGNDSAGSGNLSVAITVVPGWMGLLGEVLLVVPFASANAFGSETLFEVPFFV